jgi:hypothetical protein
MKSKAAICLAGSTRQAEEIVTQLKTAGFSYNDISVLYPDKSGTRDFAIEHNTKAPEKAAAGAGTGGILGGTLGLLAGIGTLAIPGLGPFIAAGPIMASLGGAAVGATMGGVAGALIGLGIPEYEAKQFEGKLRQGRVLVSVHTEDGKEIDRAKKIFEAVGAEDIGVTKEKATK